MIFYNKGDVNVATRRGPRFKECRRFGINVCGHPKALDRLGTTVKRSKKMSEYGKQLLEKQKIKAYYGHSIPMRIAKEEKVPPEILYHGTARRFLNSIREKGLLPKGRQYVHLSQDVETAYSVGMRHDMKPCILKIDAKQAWKEGIVFYYGNEKVWLADEIPSKYIMKM